MTERVDSYTDVELYELLIKFDGNITAVAKELGRSRRTVQERIDKNPDLVILVEDTREEMVDLAVTNIRKDLEAGDGPTSRFVAQTLGKNRGFSTAGVNKDGAVVVEIRQFAEKGDNGNKG